MSEHVKLKDFIISPDTQNLLERLDKIIELLEEIINRMPVNS